MPGNELIGTEELAEINEIFSSGAVLFGHGFEARRNGCYKVREFEDELKLKFGAYAACCSSGTAALYVALKILGVNPGDYIAIQHYNFIASVEAVIACGAIPIVIDIDNSLNICPNSLVEKFGKYQFKAVIATDMQGNPADYDSLSKICSQNNCYLIEDACQAIGGKYRGSYLGTLADIGVFSLDYGKTITTGEGGVVFTKNESVHALAKAFIDHGHANEKGVDRGNDSALVCGFNFRMSELQAAVGIAQLRKLDRIINSLTVNHQIMLNLVESKIKDQVTFRTLNDKEYLRDGIIFFVGNEVNENDLKDAMNEIGISFKNVPSAIKWHAAQYWEHVWRSHPIYSMRENRDWHNSINILNKAWSFSVSVLDNESDLSAKADKIVTLVKRFC
jgi:8-amino-3,8-dideoxy-alpha-D-manno-octulosonate transaminase